MTYILKIKNSFVCEKKCEVAPVSICITWLTTCTDLQLSAFGLTGLILYRRSFLFFTKKLCI